MIKKGRIELSSVTAVVLILSVFAHNVYSESQQSKKLSNEITGSGTNGISAGGSVSSSSLVGPSGSSAPSNNAVPIQHNSGDQYRDYGATYYYPGQKQVVWNRDSYADAASDFGYNPAAQQQQQQQAHGGSSHTAHSYVPTSEYGSPEGYEGESGSGFGGIGGLGGLGGLAGILGIKGIKGLGLLGLLKAAGLPIFALLIPALILLPLLFLFLPVPVITIPSTATGRNLEVGGFRLGDMSAKVTQLARSVLDSEKCVERMSCEISRVSRGSFIDRTLKRVIAKFESQLPKRLQRMARAYMDQNSYCNKKYTCYLVDETPVTKKSS